MICKVLFISDVLWGGFSHSFLVKGVDSRHMITATEQRFRCEIFEPYPADCSLPNRFELLFLLLESCVFQVNLYNCIFHNAIFLSGCSTSSPEPLTCVKEGKIHHQQAYRWTVSLGYMLLFKGASWWIQIELRAVFACCKCQLSVKTIQPVMCFAFVLT